MPNRPPITMAEAAKASRELVERLDRQQEAASAAKGKK